MIRQLTLLTMPVFLLGLAVGGCKEQTPSPAPAPQSQKAVPKAAPVDKKVETTETAPAPAKYVYDPSGRRDPFIPLVITKKKSAPAQATEEALPLEPLQKFELDQLRLIGIIMAKPQPFAMVTAPDGKSYTLKKGVKLGKNNGSVIAITLDAVIVQEQYIDISGEVRTTTVEIKLPKREGV